MGSNKQEEIQRRVGVGASICWPVEKGVSGREDIESMASPAKCEVRRGEYGQQVGYDGGRGRKREQERWVRQRSKRASCAARKLSCRQ